MLQLESKIDLGGLNGFGNPCHKNLSTAKSNHKFKKENMFSSLLAFNRSDFIKESNKMLLSN